MRGVFRIALFCCLFLLIALFTGCNYQESPGISPTFSADPPKLAPPPKLSGSVVYQSKVADIYQIFIVSLSTGEITQLTDEGENIEPAWSPDGTQIAYGCNKGNKHEICVMDSKGSNEHILTKNSFNDWGPNWSPDGKKLVYVSSEVPYAHLMIMDMTTGASKRLLDKEGNEGSPRWSSDGNRILYMSDRGGRFNLYTVRPDGTDEIQVTNFGQDDRPSWSPDGKKIVFRRQTTESSIFSGSEIIVANSSGKNELQLTNNILTDDWPIFSPDGKWILYSAEMGSEPQLVVLPSTGGTPAPLVEGGVFGSAPQWKP